MRILTNNGEGTILSGHGLHVTGQQSVYFKVKSCDDAFISLLDDIPTKLLLVLEVHFQRTMNIVITDYANSYTRTEQRRQPNSSWSGLDCYSYVPLWVSWFNRTVKAGAGTKIGGRMLFSWTDINYNANINSVMVSSPNQADWIFDFPAEEITGKIKIEMCVIRNNVYGCIYP